MEFEEEEEFISQETPQTSRNTLLAIVHEKFQNLQAISNPCDHEQIENFVLRENMSNTALVGSDTDSDILESSSKLQQPSQTRWTILNAGETTTDSGSSFDDTPPLKRRRFIRLTEQHSQSPEIENPAQCTMTAEPSTSSADPHVHARIVYDSFRHDERPVGTLQLNSFAHFMKISTFTHNAIALETVREISPEIDLEYMNMSDDSTGINARYHIITCKSEYVHKCSDELHLEYYEHVKETRSLFSYS